MPPNADNFYHILLSKHVTKSGKLLSRRFLLTIYLILRCLFLLPLVHLVCLVWVLRDLPPSEPVLVVSFLQTALVHGMHDYSHPPNYPSTSFMGPTPINLNRLPHLVS